MSSRAPLRRLAPLAPSTGILCLALATLVFAGCGKQGPPQPPLRAVPATTRDLSARQQGAQILLSFAYPQTAAAGTALGGITAIELWETTRPAAGDRIQPVDARQFASSAAVKLTLRGADLVAATAGDRLNIALPLPVAEAGQVLPASYYAVKTLGKDGESSELSNVVPLLPKPPPPAPDRVVVTARANGIQVEWSAVATATAGYNIYRRDAAARTSTQPIFLAAPADQSWLDTTAQFGQNYIYSVTSVAQREPILESPVTSEREVRYQDRFAPDSPRELVALAEPLQIRLVWGASEAVDVAGYLVFRRTGSQGGFERITTEALPRPEYVDTKVATGQTYSYRVVAVDAAGNESEPSTEARTSVP